MCVNIIDDWHDFHDRMLAYFLDRNRLENGRIRPSIGPLSELTITRTLYIEDLHNRVLEIRFSDPVEETESDLSCIFKDYGENQSLDMLSIELSKPDVDFDKLWELRKRWLVDGDSSEMLETICAQIVQGLR